MGQALVPQRSYTEEDKRVALRELAHCGGNYALASKRLEELRDECVPAETMRGWLRRPAYQEMYAEITTDVANSLAARLAEDQDQVALATTPVILKAIEKTSQQLDSDTHKDPSSAARNLATVTGIAVDKSRLLRDQPTEIRENRQASEVIRKLRMSGALDAIDAEAVELEDQD